MRKYKQSNKATRVAHLLVASLAVFAHVCFPAQAYLDEPEIDNESQQMHWKCGFIDKQGKPVIEAKYDGAKRFAEGLAPVCINGKWGFIDTNGDLKIPMQFEDAKSFSNGLAAVQAKGKWGFIAATGKVVILPKFLSAKKFSESLAFVEVEQNKWSCINKTGKVQFALDANVSSVDNFKGGLAVVHRSSTAEYRDPKGEKLFNEFERHSHPFSEKLACVSVSPNGWNYSYGYIDEKGKTVVEPKYARAGSFSEGLACVCVHEGEQEMLPKYPMGKWGYISKDGKVVIAPSFDDAGNFHDGMALVMTEGSGGDTSRCGYINQKGETIVPRKYNLGFDFCEGLALVREGNIWKFIDKSGTEVITTDVVLCGSFHDGRALVAKFSSESSVKPAVYANRFRFAMPIHHQYDEND